MDKIYTQRCILANVFISDDWNSLNAQNLKFVEYTYWKILIHFFNLTQ